MYINNLSWWLIIILNFAGYFIFRFGSSKNGRLSPLIEFIGGSILLFSFILMGFVFGLKEVAILIAIFMLFVTLLNELLFFKGKLVKRQEDNVQNDLKLLEEFMPGITKEDNKNKQKEIEEIIANPNLPDVIKQELIKRAKKNKGRYKMIKENKKKVVLVLLGLLFLTGWFYWFQYRPAKIRSYCDWKTKSESYWRVTKSYDTNYSSCLHEKGLK